MRTRHKTLSTWNSLRNSIYVFYYFNSCSFGRFPVNLYDVTIKSFPNYKDTESESAPCVHFTQYLEKQSNQNGNMSEDLSFCRGPLNNYYARKQPNTYSNDSGWQQQFPAPWVSSLCQWSYCKNLIWRDSQAAYHSMKGGLHFSLPLHLWRALLVFFVFMWLHMKLRTWIASLALVHI